MPKLNIGFDDVPDQIIPVAPGVYDCEVMEPPAIEPTNDQKGQKLVVQFRITSEGPEEGRQLFDHISLKMKTKLKRLAKSAGLNPADFDEDTDLLHGQTVRLIVNNRTYKDPETGEMKETSNIKDYLIGDESDPSA